MIQIKKCNTCNYSFPRTEQYFHKHNQSKDGLFGKCRTCRNKKNRDLRLDEKLKTLDMTLSEYKSFKARQKRESVEHQKEKAKQRYRENREQSLKATHDWYVANTERSAKTHRNWYKQENDRMAAMFQKIEGYSYCEHSTLHTVLELVSSMDEPNWFEVAKRMNSKGYRRKSGKIWTRNTMNTFANKNNLKIT